MALVALREAIVSITITYTGMPLNDIRPHIRNSTLLTTDIQRFLFLIMMLDTSKRILTLLLAFLVFLLKRGNLQSLKIY